MITELEVASADQGLCKIPIQFKNDIYGSDAPYWLLTCCLWVQVISL